MSRDTRAKAEEQQKLVDEIAGVELPEPTPATDHPAARTTDAAADPELARRMAELDMTDTASIVGFGARAQSGLQEISQSMLADVKNKDVGPAGDSLRQIVTALRGFSVSELDAREKPTLWERISGRATPFVRFTERFAEVQDQIDRITDDLLGHEHTLLKDIRALDLLYEKTLDFYDELALYIAAGDARLAQLDEVEIPELARAVDAAPEDAQVMKAQALRDLRAARDDLERRVHDLRLTRQVTMQSLPSIRLVQENDKSLVTKISSTLVNTVPLWESQLAQAITLQRSAEAAKAVKAANDLTNDLLRTNAENLRQTNREIRTQVERGIFDIEAVKQANADLIGTIEDSLQIADEGKARRRAAEDDLTRMEGELRDALASARSRGPAKSG